MENLIEILHREQEVLKALLDVSTLKQTSLVSNDRSVLDECTHKEEAILPRIKSIENERLREFNVLRSKFNINQNSNKLDEFLEVIKDRIDEEDFAELNILKEEIKNIVTDLSKLNQQNLYLINHSKNFLNETINTIVDKSEKSIIDRKV